MQIVLLHGHVFRGIVEQCTISEEQVVGHRDKGEPPVRNG